jgi:hypothetical protein
MFNFSCAQEVCLLEAQLLIQDSMGRRGEERERSDGKIFTCPSKFTCSTKIYFEGKRGGKGRGSQLFYTNMMNFLHPKVNCYIQT